jgi:hypothetical protein
MRVQLPVVIATAILLGCTSIEVRPVTAGLNIGEVCIEENTAVIVDDFLPVVRDGFDRHGIATKVYPKPVPRECEYVLTYTAFKTWDMATYLHRAELRLERNGRMVGTATYHLRGKGGLSLTKWASTKEKMDPVIDEMLANVKK